MPKYAALDVFKEESWLHGCVVLDLIVVLFSSHYEVIVVKEISGGVGDYETYPNATGVPPLELKEYDNAHSVPENAVYLAAVYTNGSLPDQFELGDDKRTRIMTSTMLNNRTAFNGQLMESLSYRVFVRVYAQTGLSEKVHIAVVFSVNCPCF